MIFAWRTSLRLIPPSTDNHQRYQQTENSEPGAVITESSHRHSPQRDELAVEGSCRASPKVNGREHGNGQTAATEANRSQNPLCLCKTPPHIYHPCSGSIAGRWLPNICRVGQSIGSNDWDESETWRPRINQIPSTGPVGSALANRGPRSDSETPGSAPPQLRCIHPALWATWTVGIDCARALLP